MSRAAVDAGRAGENERVSGPPKSAGVRRPVCAKSLAGSKPRLLKSRCGASTGIRVADSISLPSARRYRAKRANFARPRRPARKRLRSERALRRRSLRFADEASSIGAAATLECGAAFPLQLTGKRSSHPHAVEPPKAQAPKQATAAIARKVLILYRPPCVPKRNRKSKDDGRLTVKRQNWFCTAAKKRQSPILLLLRKVLPASAEVHHLQFRSIVSSIRSKIARANR